MTPRFWAAFFVLAIAAATAQVEQLAPGKFMVASRDLGDPNFAQSVILLMRYDDEQGAMGLIINRRSDVPVSRLLADLKEAKHRADLVYLGGPVELSSVLALLRSASKPNDSERVFGDVFLISSKALLQKTLLTKVDTEQFHVYVGYAGWGPGQLEHEVDLGAWHILSADAAEVFHSDPETVWPRLIRRTQLQIAATKPGGSTRSCRH
jgi:putative transcriptional regulator